MKKKKRRIKKKVKFVILLIIVAIIIIGGIFMYNRLFNKNNKYTNQEIEINTNTKLYDLIKNSDTINIIDENKDIDTSKLGKKTITYKTKKNEKEEINKIIINIVDTKKPSIDANHVITINVGSKEDLLANVTVTDNSNENIKAEIIGDYDINTAGEYKLKYKATDSSLNSCEFPFILKVIALKSTPVTYTEYKTLSDGEYSTSNGYTLTIKDGIAYVDGLLIVNKTYSLPSNYVPQNPYSGNVSSAACVDCIDKDTMEAFKLMQADARSLGLNIYISSGYRSYNTQKTLFSNYSNRDGETAADKYSARAGHSEHQSGYCYDLNSIDDSFANTNEGIWINENAYLYGFIIRFPKGKESITGYQYESWHLRYVGRELANKLYNNGNWITLEEYYGITSSYQ